MSQPNESLFARLRARLSGAGSSAAGVDGVADASGHHEPVGERQGRQPAPLSSYVTFINGLRYAGHGVKATMTGAQIRLTTTPPIPDTHDLYLIGQHGGEDLLVRDADAVEVHGREFFTAPKWINAG